MDPSLFCFKCMKRGDLLYFGAVLYFCVLVFGVTACLRIWPILVDHVVGVPGYVQCCVEDQT